METWPRTWKTMTMVKRTIEESDYGKHGPNKTMGIENIEKKKTMTMKSTDQRRVRFRRTRTK